VIFDDDAVATPVYARNDLLPGPGIDGPAVVEEDGSVTLVPPGFSIRCHERGALLMTRGGKDEGRS
jgi:N-methylhydantoinase A